VLRKHVYPYLESTLTRVAKFLDGKGITPNQLTLAGLAVSLVSGVIYASGHFFWGGLILFVASLADVLDGPLARYSGKTSKFGAFLDSTVDRYADVFVFGGLTLHFARVQEMGWAAVGIGIIAGSFVTSYTKARAENFVDECSVGLFERPERLIGLWVFSALNGFFRPLSLIVLLIGTNYTALQRILYTRRKLSAAPAE
jgi:CDP-diacylglycerol---glycerol-3-phosphate 3-phosphatidyltransferase